MKNKLSYIILGLLMSFSFVNSVFAEELTITADPSNKQVTKGDEVVVKLNLKSDASITSCIFKVEHDSNVSAVSKSGANGWNITQDGANGFLLENSDISGNAPSDGKNVLELKYKVNGDGKITIKTDKCIDGVTEKTFNHSDVVVNLTTIETTEDTSLSNISVTGGEMGPAFSKDVYSYAVKLNSPNFSLALTASNSDFQDKIVVIDENDNKLDPNSITYKDATGQGLMIVEISVNGGKAYELGVSYTQEGLDNSLSSLKVGGKNITLETDKVDYEIEIDSSSFEVEAVLKDNENFQFASSSNHTGTHNITDESHIVIKVEPKTSQTGATSKTYTILVKRKGGGTTTKPGGTEPSKPSSSSNVGSNPGTGDSISMFVMLFVLVASLIGSIALYQKNLTSYK